jgi:microcystin-dependent protein
MSEGVIGEIRMFAGNFAPRGWAFCQGQLLSIAQYTALYSILGTTYGGNGQTTFALPDLRGRFPMHPGQGPGLSTRILGQQGGTETVTLMTNQMPMHTHPLQAYSEAGDSVSPAGGYSAGLTNTSTGAPESLFASHANVTMNPAAVGAAGNSMPHENMSPFTCINFIICMEGIYPSRD